MLFSYCVVTHPHLQWFSIFSGRFLIQMIMSFAWWFLRTPEGFNHWYVYIFHDECCLPLVLSTITDDFNVYSFRYGDEGNVHTRYSILYVSFTCQGQSVYWRISDHISGSELKIWIHGALYWILIFGWYRGLELVPIGDAEAIVFLAPVLIVILGRLVLKEPLSAVFPGTILLTLSGLWYRMWLR